MSKSIDLTGQVFTRLTVLHRAPNSNDGKAQWVCRCECGTIKTIRAAPLKVKRERRIKSCGCLAREQAKTKNRSHGETGSREYHTWNGIKDRCHNPKSRYYPRYGGRGIIVCERWRNSFEAFLEDMGRCPAGLSLDRLDNNGPYSKDNCAWRTRKEQQRNMRSNNIAEYKGARITLAELAEILGFEYQRFSAHYRRHISKGIDHVINSFH